MKVYMLRADSDHYQGLIMPNSDLFEFARRFNGRPMEYTRMDESIAVDPDHLTFPKGDYPSLIPNVPVFSRRALKALLDVLEGNGEAYPIEIGQEEYFVFNVTRVIDALDEAHSEVIRFDDSPRVLNIRNYAFFRERLDGQFIFEIPQTIGSDIFVTDPFVNLAQSSGLRGFWFPLVWSSE